MIQARQWVAQDFEGPEVLDEVVLELPDPGAGEVTLDVRAAGMNPADYNDELRANLAKATQHAGG